MTIAKVVHSTLMNCFIIIIKQSRKLSVGGAIFIGLFLQIFFSMKTLDKILYMSLELCICYSTIKQYQVSNLGRDSCTCGQIKIARPTGIFRDYFMIITKQCKRVLCTTLAMVIISQQVMRSQFSMKIIGTRAVIKNQQSGKAQC